MVMRCSSSTTKMRSSRSNTWRDSCSQKEQEDVRPPTSLLL